uniref:FMRFamide-like neuropeptide TPGQDFMRF-amide n=1 Tax=Delia radicum TaxID=30064 RepID=FAR7_DELRA|nr:RecName: Full=FMRFamide-like neuropeptide TPGQDFMRF-amide [Delia radicum]
TPGQDFMRF